MLLGLFCWERVFKFTCTLLTLLLICQELYYFAVTKPTVTSAEEKDIDMTDLPEVVICLDTGFNKTVLKKYGYKDHYSMGSLDGKAIVGWNGNEKETKSSIEILEEALIVQKEHITFKKFITSAKYRDENQVFLPIQVNFRTLYWPHGRCFSINPTSLQEEASSSINTLYLTFNETVLNKHLDLSIKIYFMDRTSSLKIYPDDMTGNPLRIKMNEHQKYNYKIQIQRSQHLPDDPHFKCREYSTKNSYNYCAKNELSGLFDNILGCQPPFLGNDSDTVCNERLNISKDKERDMKTLSRLLYYQDVRFNCKIPCTTNKYNPKLLHNEPTNGIKMRLVFDKTISVARFTFSINSQTFLTRLGGSVSTGRTLLWILVTVLEVGYYS